MQMDKREQVASVSARLSHGNWIVCCLTGRVSLEPLFSELGAEVRVFLQLPGTHYKTLSREIVNITKNGEKKHQVALF